MEASRLNGATKVNPIIAFYSGEPDRQGRTLDQILEWSDEQLEYNHDFIQILFPLPEASAINPTAPIITREVFNAFRADSKLRDQLHRSYKRLAEFYGFTIVKGKDIRSNPMPYAPWEEDVDNGVDLEGDYLITQPMEDFAEKSKNWLTAFDHNHLRITRIIRCLRVLGLDIDAFNFHQMVWRCSWRPVNGQLVSKKTRTYWDRAMKWPLNIAPDANDTSLASGPAFLVEYEASLPEDKKSEPPRGD